MTTTPSPRKSPVFASILLSSLALLASASGAFAAAKPGKEEKRAAKREAAAGGTDATMPAKPAAEASDAKGNAANNQARVMDRLRTRLEVTDDEEWAVISARIARVEELQRNAWSSGVNNRGVITLSEKAKGAAGASANADREALRSAVTDKLPDAEIKSRLSRAHDMRQQRETALAQAQADLRSVVSVRQEAILVLAGLLSP